MRTGRALVGVGFVGVGTLFLLEEAGVLDAGEVLADWWPAVFLVAAALDLLARPPRRIGAAVFAVLGLLLVGATTDTVAGSVLALAWPLAFIALGVWLLVRRSPVTGDVAGDDAVEAVVVFSGRRIVSSSRAFRGGSLTALFGGIELDLTGAALAPGADLEAVALFGGVEVAVPPGWRVVLDGPAIFGGNDSKVPAPADPQAPTLRIRGTAIFGGVEVTVGAPTGPAVVPVG